MEEINKLATYYGLPLTVKGESFPPLINGIVLEEQFPVYKTFVCMQWNLHTDEVTSYRKGE